MDIYRVYTKKRSEFGRPLYFTDRPTEIIADIRPNIRLSRNYNVSKSVQCGVQNVQKFAEHWVNTIPFETEHQGINHVKGGWPKDIDPINVDQTARFLKRIEKDENYISTILSLGKLVEHTIKQNNTINIYEDYFTNVESNVVEEMPYVRTLNTFRDPQNPQRTANHISWCGNGGEKLAVAYCNLEFQSNTKDLSNDSYIWDIEYSSEPDYILKPISSLVCVEFNTKDAHQLVGGCYNGQVCIFDTRKSNAPVEQSIIENSHRDPVYKTIWLHTKLETEFFSASTDGKIFWWDTRRLSEPIDTLILDIDKKDRIENSYGAMSLDYEPTMPMKFMVGTEQGSIVACNRKGQTNADKIGHVYAGHSGPVCKSVGSTRGAQYAILTPIGANSTCYPGILCDGTETSFHDCKYQRSQTTITTSDLFAIITRCIVDGGFSSWSDWSTCTKSCGNGESTRSRTCTQPSPSILEPELNSINSSLNGMNCTGDYTQVKTCNKQKC
ncbi:unnamed protein product [Adineta steineri]|uniref:Uncharacterized protein n=1 Tax=Adineta steineri TaxID=433720 RepID=A0A814QTL5_9BILA|nr:unnamed protein product [Adineta steineri]